MSSKGCHSHFEETLSKVKGALKMSVYLQKAEATIEEALKNDGGSYSIHHLDDAKHSEDNGILNHRQF